MFFCLFVCCFFSFVFAVGGLGGQAFQFPGKILLKGVTQAVVHPVGTALPEFDHPGAHQVQSAVGRPGYVLAFELFLEVFQPAVEVLAGGDYLALLRSPGSQARASGTGGEVSVRDVGRGFFRLPRAALRLQPKKPGHFQQPLRAVGQLRGSLGWLCVLFILAVRLVVVELGLQVSRFQFCLHLFQFVIFICICIPLARIVNCHSPGNVNVCKSVGANLHFDESRPNADGLQARAALKCRIPDGFQTVGQVDALQAGAAVEGTTLNSGQAVGQGNAGQVGAATECSTPDAGQVGAAFVKRPIFAASHLAPRALLGYTEHSIT